MGIAFRVGDHIEEIGTEDFLYAFFSTIGSLLEPRGWGTRYPEIMNSLYRGELHRSKARKAIEEVRDIRVSLAQFSPDQVVWDIDNRDKQPPWGNTVSSDIVNLSTYFVTSNGNDLLDTIEDLLLIIESGTATRLIIDVG